MSAARRDPRIDAYIARSAPFAEPILREVRELVHRAVPGVEETVKWGMPCFRHDGRILCHLAAFKAHCAFGFWHHGMLAILGDAAAKADSAMGSFGRITARADLPGPAVLLRYLRAARKLIDDGVPARRRSAKKPRSRELPVPSDLADALRGNAVAGRTFAAFPPSHRKDYIEWITEAKRPETRARRVATTLAWVAAGKSRNWKYQAC
jgi:uncharacterized protein YdeI (YjbR/CyaY-like superfamily)